MGKVTCFVLMVISIFLSLPEPPTFAANSLIDIKYWSAPDHTRIVLYTNKPVTWNMLTPDDPKRLTIEVDNVAKILSGKRIRVDDSIVREIRILKSNRETVRLALYLVKAAKWDIFNLDRYLQTPPRMVIDVSRPDLAERERMKRIAMKKSLGEEVKMVVVDPGHGGEDLGAVGRYGTREKQVVLAIGKELQRLLNREKGFKAALTRSDDYFIPLEERRGIAREYGADLVISLHADWTAKKDVKGTSLYCLSSRGASDRGAELLAEKENLSNFIGGVSVKPGNQDLQVILLDLLQTKTINDSLRFGGFAIKEVKKINKIKYDRPKQAAFTVLKAPDIPSVLVEIGYLSNSGEERLLKSKGFQRRFAGALSKATLRFLSGDALKGKTIAKEKTLSRKKERVHIVREGDNLWKIASKYRVSVRDLQMLNRLKDANHIVPGRRLRLP
ncbi:MAG: N-acetylmuramoyl-L-alanine amidase [Pseudomonadota bacterium]